MMEKANFKELELLTIAMAGRPGKKFYQNGAKILKGSLAVPAGCGAAGEEHKEVFKDFMTIS